MSLASQSPSSTVDLVVERIVFQNSESGWTVARVRLEKESRLATAVGRLFGVHAGERLRVTATWVRDRKYGRQLAIESFVTLEPASLRGVERFLAAGFLPGVGKVMAKRLVERFGDATLEVLDTAPERLTEIPGIGKVKAKKIAGAWTEQRRVRDAMIFLQTHEVTPGYAARIVKRFGTDTVGLVKRNPYRLADEISGIGFAAADRVARSLGWARDADERIASGILYSLRQTAASEGHLFLPIEELVSRTSTLLDVDPVRVEGVIPGLARRHVVVLEKGGEGSARVYLSELHVAETRIASHLAKLTASRIERPDIEADRALGWFEERSGLRLAPAQRAAIAKALTTKVLILTGGPGTGKTTLVRAVVDILSHKGLEIQLAAPTGRAANRLAEATSREVRTIHRLLEFDPHSLAFRRCAERPLEADLVVVDESSMIDAALASALLEAIADTTRLLIVGDADQLPSVGPGSVLSDLIDCQRIPVVRLEEIFRQREADSIIVNAHRIHRGRPPKPDSDGNGSFFFIRRSRPEEILELVLEFVTERVPRRFGLSPTREVQVLSPMRRGILGTETLNGRLRELLNPGSRGEGVIDRWLVGDRVMQTRNNYDLDVFNGDIGFVSAVDRASNRLIVDFDRRPVSFQSGDLEDLTLAYACTVHKSQGSEYPCVVLPLHTQHFMMLQRNLLYTAVTRAQRLMIIVGDARAMEIALANRRQMERFSGLAERLRSSLS
jgi:exodeoxyribonuclease V alpha subunit